MIRYVRNFDLYKKEPFQADKRMSFKVNCLKDILKYGKKLVIYLVKNFIRIRIMLMKIKDISILN